MNYFYLGETAADGSGRKRTSEEKEKKRSEENDLKSDTSKYH